MKVFLTIVYPQSVTPLYIYRVGSSCLVMTRQNLSSSYNQVTSVRAQLVKQINHAIGLVHTGYNQPVGPLSH
jgi:hypothetical protein